MIIPASPRYLLLASLACGAWGCPVPNPSARDLSVPELLERGHALRARALLKDADLKNPANAYLLSRADSALGDLDAALKLAEQALASDEKNPAYHVQVAAVAGRMAEKASLFKQLGLAKRAKKELDTAVALDPKNLDALYGLMLFHYAAPGLIGGDKQKTQEIAETMTAVNPGRGYLAQARLAKERNDAAKEEEFYKKAVEADPRLYEAAALLSSFYLNSAKPDYAAAEQYACEAVAIDPSRADGWKNLVEVRAFEQCWTEVSDLLEQAVQADPDDLAGYYVAGEAMMRASRRLPVAEAYLRKYLAAPIEANEPSSGYAHWQLGTILKKQGRTAEAAAEYERAVEDEPSLEGPKKDLKRLGRKP